MTPTPKCLKEYGVIKNIFSNSKDIVKPENVDRQKLHTFAREVSRGSKIREEEEEEEDEEEERRRRSSPEMLTLFLPRFLR